MDFAQQQRNPMRHVVSIGLVLLLHVLIVWALMSGLARKVIQVIQVPIETKIIEEVAPPPPPPPEVKLPTPPKFQPPPPLYVPPPEVVVQAPPPPNVVTAVTTTPPVEPPPPIVVAPPPPPLPAPAPPAPPPPPAIQSAAVACSNFRTKMGDAAFPREALRQGIDRGEVLVQFTLGPAGQIKDIEVLRATHRVFARQSTQIVSELICAGQGRDVKVQVPFSYKLE